MMAEDLTKTLTNTYRCANWALIKARHLKTLFQEQAKSDLEQVYKNVVYEWLPSIPKFENQSIDRYLSGKSLEDITKDIAEKTQLMVAPVELAISDSDGEISNELKVMHGLLGNMLEELNFTLNIPEENINLIPSDLKGVDQTSRSLRDWLFIRSLVEVLEYAVAVFEHFGVTLEVN